MAFRRLSIRAVIDLARARLWQRAAIDALRAQGHEVQIRVSPIRRPLPAVVVALLALERLVCRRKGSGLGDDWLNVQSNETAEYQPDLIVDFTSQASENDSVRTLRILYSGSPLEEFGHLALLTEAPPVLGIVDSADAGRTRTFHIAIESTCKLSRGLDAQAARLKALLVRAVSEIASGGSIAGKSLQVSETIPNWSLNTTLAALQGRAASAIKWLATKPPHWHVGWRRVSDGGIRASLRIPAGGWTKLPDDGKRFYADPFVINDQGRDWMLVEEFPYATRKGILSAIEIGPEGPKGAPQPFLELPHHLSYPFVFRDNGAIWMIPESHSAGRVELYRAKEFPRSWEPAGVLIDGEAVSDPTVVTHNGRYYLFGTLSGDGLFSWDTLKIWSAPALVGPWTASGDQPALIDARSARPAGHFFMRAGALWRPAQDCSTGYGAGLALASVDRLDPEGFSQTVQVVLRPNSDWPGVGIHTLNLENGLEAVDGCST